MNMRLTASSQLRRPCFDWEPNLLRYTEFLLQKYKNKKINKDRTNELITEIQVMSG